MEKTGSRRRLITIAVLALLGGAVLTWFGRTSILTWWYVRNLKQADEQSRQQWAERVVSMGEEAVPSVLDSLHEESEPVCVNSATALGAFLDRWGKEDPRSANLVKLVGNDFDAFSPAGRACAVGEIQRSLCNPDAVGEWNEQMVLACLQLMEQVGKSSESKVIAPALNINAVLLTLPLREEMWQANKAVMRAGLSADDPEVRIRAIQLGLRPQMDLFEEIAVLLQDSTVEVRQAALLAVGPVSDRVTDESLLPCLRDKDSRVRRLCEAALRARGLSSQHIQMAKLLVDPNPQVRLELLDHLRFNPDLDPAVWLRRLSHDPADSVRAASVRVMGMQRMVDLRDRLDQMAQNDPSPTVCELAGYYLERAHASYK